MRLFHSLNNNGDPPYSWIVSRVCEEFYVLPSQAIEELENDPDGFAIEIITLRAFAQAKQSFDNCKKLSDLQITPMVEKLMEIDMEEARKELEERNG